MVVTGGKGDAVNGARQSKAKRTARMGPRGEAGVHQCPDWAPPVRVGSYMARTLQGNVPGRMR